MKRVVVIGGGHGQSTILKGIKNIDDVKLTAIVTVADNGGSTGRIRNLYHIPAMGDIRSVLIALSEEESVMKELMDYRFISNEKEEDVAGHSLGNLILTALTDMSGSFLSAISEAAAILKVKGAVVPSTLEFVELFAIMDDGTLVKGEDSIPSFNHHIKKVFYQKKVTANLRAVEEILKADLIIYGIGSVYTSIIPNIIIPDIQAALQKSKALKLYMANCMTQNNETFDYTLQDHINALKKHGAVIDLVVKHNDPIPPQVIAKYAKQNSIEVRGYDPAEKVVAASLLSFKDDLVRHDSAKIKTVIEGILKDL